MIGYINCIWNYLKNKKKLGDKNGRFVTYDEIEEISNTSYLQGAIDFNNNTRGGWKLLYNKIKKEYNIP